MGNLDSDEVDEMTFSDVTLTQRFYQTFVSGTNRRRSKVGVTKGPRVSQKSVCHGGGVSGIFLAAGLDPV